MFDLLKLSNLLYLLGYESCNARICWHVKIDECEWMKQKSTCSLLLGTMIVLTVLQVFLTKHYRNRRLGDPEFMLDFEEIYVIDSKTKSITRGKVVVRKHSGFELTICSFL